MMTVRRGNRSGSGTWTGRRPPPRGWVGESLGGVPGGGAQVAQIAGFGRPAPGRARDARQLGQLVVKQVDGAALAAADVVDAAAGVERAGGAHEGVAHVGD